MIIRLTDAVQTTHSFFNSPLGIIVLTICTTIAGALTLFVIRGMPKLIERMDGIHRALMGEPARPEYGIPARKGLIRQVEELQTSQTELEQHVTDSMTAVEQHVTGSIAEVRKEMQRELAAIRRGLRTGKHEDERRT